MIRWLVIAAGLLAIALVPLASDPKGVRIGSKKFTEAVILGEMLVQLCRDQGVPATHLAELGGTRLVYEALRKGEIDAYVEYTGTLRQEIFPVAQGADVSAALARDGIHMSPPLGFNNTYALAAKRETAERLNLRKISDLARHPELKLGFGNEFMDRRDGWRNLRKQYGLPHQRVRGMDHDVAYRQLELGAVDVIDIYTTDAKLERLDAMLLEDDRSYFPRYDAVVLYRSDLQRHYPQVVASWERLSSQISNDQMLRLNGRAELEGVPGTRVAAEYLAQRLGIQSKIKEPTIAGRVWRYTLQHLNLVRKSLIPAILVAIPLGIVAAKRRKFGQVILAGVGIVQTIPALALLVLLMPLLANFGFATIGVGSSTAIVALFLYSLLPIVRNTATGLTAIQQPYHESAEALGLAPLFKLTRIELPLASPSILSGIKTAAVINVGFATLGALIGAGGYGQPILTGIRLNDAGLIMQGALPAAGLAMVFQCGFELAERWLVPRGLRLHRRE